MKSRNFLAYLAISFGIGNVLFANRVDHPLLAPTSVSGSYNSRSVFINPAALAFDTELNGAGFTSSYTYGYNHSNLSELMMSIAYGNLAFGWEKFDNSAGRFSRFSLASALPITSQVFLGTRFSFTSSDTSALSGVHSFDLGIQYRPIRYVSVGIMANSLNRRPIQWVAGVTARPIDRLELAFDVETPSDNFIKNVVYSADGRFEVLPGLSVFGGYHETLKIQAGLQINLGRAELFAFSQPQKTPDGAKFATGFQTANLPRNSFVTPKSALKLKIDGNLSEEAVSPTFFSKGTYSLFDILQALDEAATDASTDAVVLRIEKFPLGFAAAHDVHQAILRLKEKGKRVEVFLGNAGATEYLIASAATKIHMEPMAELRLLGPRSERFYAKGTLDKIGVDGQFLAKGDYKSAPEFFTRKEGSPKSREAILSELKALDSEFADILAKNRKISPADYQKILEHALFSPNDALKFKLVDAITSYTEGEETLKKELFVRESSKLHNDRLNLPARVAVITAEGDILRRKIGLLPIAGRSQITPERFEKHLKQAMGDERTKAIVIRVSSPGGEILPSHEIGAMVEKAAAKKPIIISMGDVAASGGYLISAPSQTIFADPFTATGSIGVFLGKISLEGLFKKIDLRKEIISKYPYAGIFSESKNWNDKERALMNRKLDQYYDEFVGYVAKHRKLKTNEVETAAQGRVWLGREALRQKLVDKSGGLWSAIQFASETAGISQTDLEVWPVVDSFGLLSMLEPGWGMRSESLDTAKFLLGEDATRNLHWMNSLRESPFLYWDPVRFD